MGFGANLSGYNNYSLLGNGTDTIISRPSGGVLSFREGNTTQMSILPGGNVGIGTASPTGKLTVSGAGAFNAAGAARFDLVNAAANKGYFQHVLDDGRWQLGTGNTTRILIDNNGNVGIGTSAPTLELQVADTIVPGCVGGGPPLGCHVALIENAVPGLNGADVLALKIGRTDNPTSFDDFITFLKGTGEAVGAIEGNGFGGVSFGSGSSDYAEWLPRLNPIEQIQPGEIVGLFAGRITKNTQGATQVMAVSTGPIVLGNDPGEKARAEYEKVAFIGQIMVRVRGAVKAGDFIIASGLNDGTGVAVSPECITAEEFEQAVGQAWESSDDAGVKSVRTAVGLIHRDPTVNRLIESGRKQATQIAELNARLAAIELKIDKKNIARKTAAKRKSKALQSRAR